MQIDTPRYDITAKGETEKESKEKKDSPPPQASPATSPVPATDKQKKYLTRLGYVGDVEKLTKRAAMGEIGALKAVHDGYKKDHAGAAADMGEAPF